MQMMKVLINNKDVYSQQKYDKGKTKQNFFVKWSPNSTLTKQRPSKVRLH